MDTTLSRKIRLANLVADSVARRIWVNDIEVPLGDKAFDILITLLAADGRVRTKENIFEEAWGDAAFSENRLQVHISAIRRAIGPKIRLETVRGVGYRLVAEASESESELVPTNLPSPASELVGRDQVLKDLVSLVAHEPVVTLVGTGGIGKTRLALAAAYALAPRFPDGVWLVQLGNISGPELVLQTFTAAVGIEVSAGQATLKRVASALKNQKALIVLDNCEHVPNAAANLVDEVVKGAKDVRFLVTSREAIQVPQEFVLTVPPLEAPILDAGARGEQIAKYSAVALFLRRIQEAHFQFLPDDSTLRDIAAICVRLDCLPLAIELAAARAAVLGVRDVLERLNDRFSLLTSGRRTAVARHQTLRASVDWSYNLLDDSSREALCFLAVFSADFTMEAGCEVVRDAGESAESGNRKIHDLVSKSFVQQIIFNGRSTYKLLETARVYALEKLSEGGLESQARRRHAVYHMHLASSKYRERERHPIAHWIRDYGARVEDVRSALEWSGSPAGSPEIQISLAAAASVLWIRLNLFEECLIKARLAIGSLGRVENYDVDQAIQLYLASGESSFSCKGPLPATFDAYTTALELSNRAGDAESQLRAIWGQYATRLTEGDTFPLLELGLRFREVAATSSTRSDVLIAERLIGLAMHFRGDHAAGRRKIQRMLDEYTTREYGLDTQRFKFDQRMQCFILLSGILWIEGLPEQALRAALNAVDAAREVDHTSSLVQALAAAACSMAISSGQTAKAESLIEMLGTIGSRHALQPYIAWSRYYGAFLHCRLGNKGLHLNELNLAFRELREATRLTKFIPFLCEHIDWMGPAAIDEIGVNAIDELLVSSTNTGQVWCIPELLRVKAKLLLLQDNGDVAKQHAAQLLFSAIESAEEQRALCCQLRATVDLYHIRMSQRRGDEVAGLLKNIYDEFHEGFDTPDLQGARALLEQSATSIQ